MVLIARALAQEAPVLILDEPLANLDFGYQALLAKHLRALAANGHAILMSGHDPQFAHHTSSRIVALLDGRIEMDGVPTDVLTEETTQKIYGIRVERVTVSCGRVVFFPDRAPQV